MDLKSYRNVRYPNLSLIDIGIKWYQIVYPWKKVEMEQARHESI